ncbi:ABC transporter substrate-binding protein [Ferroplasma acidiphilum]|jgi:ABC-type transport system substrate-binding protein|uniref:ABC transporter substrate-binding protein n=3 Tax=Ferroplasma acidiphilum TaxID=74969 RepID=A0A1V0N394_9ARCH|nr:ABC transporter substrate-binding protein [Ferroplasma acidiphilum]ARD84565.1 ABC transporter substrate-binding protein [Ferroplasma acidiphilum]WMT53498.1 MAG: ABC transporter substrate-binding protein [Ferroplasma acidiphilum]
MKKGLKIIIVVVVAIILVSTAFLVLYHPTHAFTDTSQTAAPEQLDPATGFFTTNGPLFSAVFQTLVEYNGSSTNVTPVLASHVTNLNDTHYIFTMRSGANFSNGQPLNATSAWFSFARGIVMGQGPYAADYSGTLFNGTMAGITGVYLPVGIIPALINAGYHISNTTYKVNKTVTMNTYNYTIAGNDLASILSHFNYNATEMKVMNYANQSLVVNSNGTFQINTEHKYAFLLSAIAGWWGDIVEPSYVDAHDGVQVNTPNSYLDANGVIGSGPYEISSVGKGFSTIVLKANPNYWVTSAMVNNGSISAIAKPASIKTVVIDYGLSHADRLEDFDRGISQISTVSPSSFKQMINGFHNKTERTGALVKSYNEIGVFYISMNTQRSYTNNTHFREALYNAMNYTAQLKVYNNNYNGTPEAYTELGPLSPVFGKAYYNPNNYPLPKQNLTAAIANITTAGKEMGFYVTLPNGSKVGDTSGTDLSHHTFAITGISPATSIETASMSAAISSFTHIGLTFKTSLVTESTVSGWTNASATPHFVDLGWLPDYLDPIGQQLIDVYSPAAGGAFGGNDAWVDNTSLNANFTNLDFKNISDQKQAMYNVQNLTYNQYAYMWTPMPDAVYFVAPNVHGFVYNNITSSYFYNMMTFTGKLTSSVGFMTLYTLVADIEMAFTNAAPKF